MHTLSSLLRIRGCGLLAVVALALAPTVARADKPAGALAFTVTVPAGKLSVQEVHDAVLAASINRQWEVKEDSTERIVIYLNHRKNEATVTYLVSDKSVEAYCEGYATNGKGVRKKPEQPSGWLKNLKEDIGKQLNLAAYVNK